LPPRPEYSSSTTLETRLGSKPEVGRRPSSAPTVAGARPSSAPIITGARPASSPLPAHVSDDVDVRGLSNSASSPSAAPLRRSPSMPVMGAPPGRGPPPPPPIPSFPSTWKPEPSVPLRPVSARVPIDADSPALRPMPKPLRERAPYALEVEATSTAVPEACPSSSPAAVPSSATPPHAGPTHVVADGLTAPPAAHAEKDPQGTSRAPVYPAAAAAQTLLLAAVTDDAEPSRGEALFSPDRDTELTSHPQN